MPEHENVYKNETEQYHALVSYEDYKLNLPAALGRMIGNGLPAILESGAGTIGWKINRFRSFSRHASHSRFEKSLFPNYL